MKKIIRITENDLRRIISRIVEQTEDDQEQKKPTNLPQDVIMNAVMGAKRTSPEEKSDDDPNKTAIDRKKFVAIDWVATNFNGKFKGTWMKKFSEIELYYVYQNQTKMLLTMPIPKELTKDRGTWEVIGDKFTFKQ